MSDEEHPTQVISDIFTIREIKGKSKLRNLKIVYFGDGNNIANSLALIAKALNLNLIISCPKGYEPSNKILKLAGKNLIIDNNPFTAAKNADVIYTDVWTSMGMEKEEKKRLKAFKDFQVNKNIVKLARKDFLFMHCLPAHVGEEVTQDVLNLKNSVVYRQAENKVYSAMAILDHLLS